jgi:hypothetical protein
VVIEAAGLRFVADRGDLLMVANLRIEVDARHGEPMLLLAHPAWAPYGCVSRPPEEAIGARLPPAKDAK